jgi:hypothetical protein
MSAALIHGWAGTSMLAPSPQHLLELRRILIYSFTNSQYSTWDAQFYPDGVPGVQAMCKVGANGGMELDREFYVDFGSQYGAHQVRLQGGDCSTDSFCYPSA